MYKLLLLPFLFWCSLANAGNSVLNSLLQNDTFLPVEQAFRFDFVQQDQQLIVSWNIADGYYLYKDKIKLGGIAVSFSHPSYPAAIETEDEFFGVTEVYYHQLTLRIPLSDIGDDAQLRIQYMGCAEAGLCYPPQTLEVPLIKPATAAQQQENDLPVSAQHTLADKLTSGATLATLGMFFLLGLGLAFTPCVFPMYPILTSIIVGQKTLSTKRAFTLSFTYVQGMALTYSALGLVVASLGVQFQAYLQHPAILISASVMFIVLALAMFGLFNFTLPARWQEKISSLSNRQQGGSLKGAFIMGALSGLIASPCTTAPLSGALLYVAQSGDLLLGALTLYILSMGMGLPLLLLGSSGGKLLPKAGNWMNSIKIAFGFLLLAVPLLLLERLLPGWIILLCTAVLLLAVVFALYRLLFQLQNINAKAILAITGQLLLVVALWLGWQIWQPAAVNNLSAQTSAITPGHFITVSSLEELQQQVQLAGQQQKYTMVDLYADWCIACKEFEHLTFPKPEVQHYFQQMQLIKVDVTKMSRTDQQLLDHFQVLGLPTLLFFSPDGTELTTARVTGFMAAGPFAEHLQKLIK
ncbi:protein-disulfide reductase DsbD [Chromatiaceae bacterium AAb-1]|nr:protein-disulfide reductase DsbD [Chromatiaceae bacterium AAb-1]